MDPHSSSVCFLWSRSIFITTFFSVYSNFFSPFFFFSFVSSFPVLWSPHVLCVSVSGLFLFFFFFFQGGGLGVHSLEAGWTKGK